MTENTIRKFKWFWAWQDDKEEAWLTQMSREGWHLASLGFPGFYNFTVGEPSHYVYRLDFFTETKDYTHYLQLFKDAGWEHLGRWGGWQYFRILAQEGESPEIYTDPDSKVQKYRRLLAFLIVFLPVWNVVILRNLGSSVHEVLQFISFVAYIAFMTIYIIAVMQLIRRIKALKQL
ncbi:MAG TPA: DUF2812 domain-containing protein [Anaerolineae bacterium]|nr:DUF2812 domain-containing protein [Anaerolineae bacterium]